MILILFLECLFIYGNINKISDLNAQLVKQGLKGDALLIRNVIDENGTENFQIVAENVQRRFTLIAKNGDVLYDSEKRGFEEELATHKYRDEVRAAYSGEEGFDIRMSESVGRKLAYYAVPYNDEFIIRVATDYAYVDKELYKLILIYIVFFAVLNSFVVISYRFYLKNYLYKRLGQIKKILINEVKPTGIDVEGDKFLKEFWDVVKTWQNKNLKNMVKLENERQKLREIISIVDMGILVINKRKEIILNNSMLGLMSIEGEDRHYYNKIKYIEFIHFIDKLLEKKTALKEEIYFNKINKHYIMEGKYLGLREHYLVTLKDVSKSREIMEIQRNFISNVSHELKTPLSNVKGYLIAIEGEKDEFMKKQFFKIVHSNIEKLENIIMDFLNISKIESTKLLNVDHVQFSKLKEELEKILNSKIEKKNAELIYKVSLQNKQEYINVDFEKLSSILKNLVENAIVYNDKDKPIINIDFVEKDDKYEISVKDNGLGIPVEEQKNIFNRFYRVDKARTSNVAGTGLGLSIVYELVKLCGGEIELISKEGEGSEFKFTVMKI
jgi:two-component system phosphate regulon sensor histidine kinase PhoR